MGETVNVTGPAPWHPGKRPAAAGGAPVGEGVEGCGVVAGAEDAGGGVLEVGGVVIVPEPGAGLVDEGGAWGAAHPTKAARINREKRGRTRRTSRAGA
jgi:hypothetical protein